MAVNCSGGLRLLRNYAGKIPDPKIAHPGLDGKHGALTRLSIQQWHMIQERHSPVMISENVPFQDMEDQWAEVETGWGVPAYVHNSAANAHTHRNRAWWITQGNTEKPLHVAYARDATGLWPLGLRSLGGWREPVRVAR